ncbi:unnamed protein product, partial [Adineta ricciae]
RGNGGIPAALSHCTAISPPGRHANGLFAVYLRSRGQYRPVEPPGPGMRPYSAGNGLWMLPVAAVRQNTGAFQ